MLSYHINHIIGYTRLKNKLSLYKEWSNFCMLLSVASSTVFQDPEFCVL
jgi:hypothetical protein